MRVRSKFWLEDEEGEAIFGEGRRKILELIEELGSMQAAAKALNMSYRGVWARIKATEKRLQLKLVETSVGRGKNRGSRLTPEAKRLLQNYKKLTQEGITYTDQLFEKIVNLRDTSEKPIPPVVAVVGNPGSGKRDLISNLVETWVAKGRLIGVVRLKDGLSKSKSPGIKPYLAAGAGVAMEADDSRLDVRLPDDQSLTPETIGVNFCPGCDLVLVESAVRRHLPTIDVFRKSLDKAPLTRKKKNIVVVVGDDPEKKGWPHLNDNDYEGIIDLVEKTVFDEPPQSMAVNLTVNGRRVPMLPFVQDIIAQGLVGMISSLKSCENPQRVELTVNLNQRDD